MMTTPQNSLFWLDQLSASVPGYSGYRTRESRRKADEHLRKAIAAQLDVAADNILRVRERMGERDTPALDRVLCHIDRVKARVMAASAGVHSFFEARAFRDSKADALHAIDHAMLEVANDFAALTTSGKSTAHDWLVHIERELIDLEQKLDARAQVHLLAAQGEATKD